MATPLPSGSPPTAIETSHALQAHELTLGTLRGLIRAHRTAGPALGTAALAANLRTMAEALESFEAARVGLLRALEGQLEQAQATADRLWATVAAEAPPRA